MCRYSTTEWFGLWPNEIFCTTFGLVLTLRPSDSTISRQTHQILQFLGGPYKRTQTAAHQCLLRQYMRRCSIRVAVVHKGEKESFLYCGCCSTQGARVHKMPLLVWRHLVTSPVKRLLWPQYTSRSIWGIKEYLVYCGAISRASCGTAACHGR